MNAGRSEPNDFNLKQRLSWELEISWMFPHLVEDFWQFGEREEVSGGSRKW